MGSKVITDLWKDSFTYKVINIVKKKFIKGLKDSFIVSTFLKDNNIYGKAGLLVRFEEKLFKLVTKALKNIRHALYRPICDSVLVNLAISTGKIILSDIYRFWLTTIGTSILVFGVLSTVKRVYSAKEMILFVIIGGLLLILGRLDVELDRIFSDSKFIRAIKKIFDYNS